MVGVAFFENYEYPENGSIDEERTIFEEIAKDSDFCLSIIRQNLSEI